MSAPRDAPRAEMPSAVRLIYAYEVFNAISWSAVLSSPLLLFFQRLNASATVLALAASIAPIMTILQIPAARYVEQIGYRRLVVGGWTARSTFIVGMAVVAFLPEAVGTTPRLVAMLPLLLAYNVLRGISVCGLMPWFTHLVPESRRGEFLAMDQLASAVALVVSLAVFSWIPHAVAAAYAFGLVFSLSAVSAFVSVRFLRRVPDVEVPPAARNPTEVPWKEMLFHPPFRHYLRYNAVINLALGASGVFWVRFFRDALHIGDAHILLVGALTVCVLALALFLASSIIDRTGSRPALVLSGGIFTGHFSVWALAAAGLLPASHALIVFQCFTSGLAGALWNLANLRAVLGIVPVMGRAHFLALYSVIANLTVGLIPLAWGPVFDGLGHWQAAWGPWHWNVFSLFYLVLALTMLGGLALLQGVEEPEAMTWDEFTRELLVRTPARGVSRLLGRLRAPGV